MTTETKPAYNVVGTRPIRPDGVDKVTGRANYGADISLPGMLYGRILRSPHAHARILSIDASKAEALDGVRCVITHADLPGASDTILDFGESVSPYKWVLEQTFASEKVLYQGHPVAGLCATDPHIAEDALSLIEVEYEVLPPVLSVHDAMADGAPILHDGMKTVEMVARFVPGDGRSDRDSNIASQLELEHGDPAAGFEEADIILEGEYETAAAHQGYIEPQTGTALWNPDGTLTIWTSSQGPFAIRDTVAHMLGIPMADVKVIPMEIGGGFGGKTKPYMEPAAAMMSKQTGRPVKMYMNREEVLIGTGPTSATYVRCKIGAKNDGTLVAGEATLAYEAGAFPGSPVGAGASCMFSSYDVPNLYVNALDVLTNKPKAHAYRAPGSPQATYAVESLLDQLAERLERDPMELRAQNAAQEGTRRADGTRMPAIGAEETMQAAMDSPHYRSELGIDEDGRLLGRGVAMGFWHNAGGESSAYAMTNSDGTVNLSLGSVDIGGQRAGLAMQFAETMGIGYEQVRPQVVDTDQIGFTNVTGGSRVSYASGLAVHEAALEMQQQLTARVARIWDCDEAAVSYADGAVHGPDGQSMPFAELCGHLQGTGGQIQGAADVSPNRPGPAFGCHIVDVAVDQDTGKVDVLRYSAVQDVGTAVHPDYAEGQVQGGAAQGIGMALSEEYVYSPEGRMTNASLLDYRMPTSLDLPEIETILVEVPNPSHPYGVRGVGEVPIVPPLAAIANAIYDATGIRMNSLPASPTKLLDRLLDD
ncbi:MAG: xanthine dehydrogenase family protein molybdopterin-binding subunit [Chloroflexota bacterium]|nr:xanthine dehydrogenase family protein molybdopterin-binding subunit [Chloroflexota bacterium]